MAPIPEATVLVWVPSGRPENPKAGERSNLVATLAFLGRGLMGAPMATRLLEARHDVTVWNRTGRRTRTGRTPAPPDLSVDRAQASRPEQPSEPT